MALRLLKVEVERVIPVPILGCHVTRLVTTVRKTAETSWHYPRPRIKPL